MSASAAGIRDAIGGGEVERVARALGCSSSRLHKMMEWDETHREPSLRDWLAIQISARTRRADRYALSPLYRTSALLDQITHPRQCPVDSEEAISEVALRLAGADVDLLRTLKIVLDHVLAAHEPGPKGVDQQPRAVS